MKPLEILLPRLDKVKEIGGNRWSALCPHHNDNHPSLGIREESDGKLLINCLAGCQPAEVLDSVGLELKDLFPEGALYHHQDYSYEREMHIVRQVNDLRKTGKRITPNDLNRVGLALKRIKNEGRI